MPGRMASVAADQRDPARAGAQVVSALPLLPYDWHGVVSSPPPAASTAPRSPRTSAGCVRTRPAGKRGANPGKFLAPSTTLGLRTRNSLFRTRLIQRMLISSTKTLATDPALPDYAAA